MDNCKALWFGARLVLEGGDETFMQTMPESALGMPADELYADPLLAGLVREMRDTYETGRHRTVRWGEEEITLVSVKLDGGNGVVTTRRPARTFGELLASRNEVINALR